jgi:hypothetical protein
LTLILNKAETMNPRIRWSLQNLAWLLVVIPPVIVLLSALLTALTGTDTGAVAPKRVLGDLAVLYPTIALPLLAGGLVQCLFVLALARRVILTRIALVALTPIAFLPLILAGYLSPMTVKTFLPVLFGWGLYAAVVISPPSPALAT